MADFRKKLFGLTCAVTMFTGMAFGQNLCSTTTTATATVAAGASFIRSEGQTELLPQITITCSASGVAGSANISLFLSPAVTVTSKVLSGSYTEAMAVINGAAVAGTVIGSAVSFTNVPFAATATTVTISNVRINASSLPAGSAGSLPTPIAAQAFISGTGVTPTPSTSPNVAYAFSAVGANTGKVYRDQGNNTSGTIFAGSNTSTYAVCTSSNTSSTTASNSPNFFIAVNEGFTNAFKSQADELSSVPIASISTTGATTGQVTPLVGAPTSANTINFPNSGTRIKVVFNNVPTGLNIYVGQVIDSVGLNSSATPVVNGDSTTLTLIASETAPTGAANITTASTTGGLNPTLAAPIGTANTLFPFAADTTNAPTATFPNVPGGLVLLTVSGTTATAVYEVSADNAGAIDNFSIPVVLNASSNKVLPGPAMTVTTSVAPQPATAASIVPSFSGTAASIVTTNTLTFSACTTNLLFPFVTNVNGYETGIAISNTSKDPFGSAGATPQSGLCTLSFFQSGVSGATNPTAVTAPNLAEGTNQPFLAGETYAFTLTQALGVNAANPATFQGYMIAACNFNFGHGFGYILGGLQPGMFINPNNTAMGYLAIVLTRGSTGAAADSAGN
jgi:hypothetical protein